MVTGGKLNKGTKTTKASNTVEMAVLETITANLNAGIKFVDTQEISLAKIGGKLSEIALSLNKTKSPSASDQERGAMQSTFERAKAALFQESISAFDQSALFSNGPSKPVTVAVPTGNEWEGLVLLIVQIWGSRVFTR
jgi:flagellin-like hook-associated protein FlgL